MEAKLERGDDPEVSTATLERPEQIRMSGCADVQQTAVGGHDVRRDQVVARHAERPAEPTLASAESQPRDTRSGDDAADGDQPEGLRLAVDVAPRGAPLDSREPVVGVDADGPHRRQVDHDAAVAGRKAGGVVRATAHGNEQIVVSGEMNGPEDVSHAAAADDHRRPFVDRLVEDATRLLIVDATGQDRWAGEVPREVVDRSIVDVRFRPRERCSAERRHHVFST
jgi:hypothetical protein